MSKFINIRHNQFFRLEHINLHKLNAYKIKKNISQNCVSKLHKNIFVAFLTFAAFTKKPLGSRQFKKIVVAVLVTLKIPS